MKARELVAKIIQYAGQLDEVKKPPTAKAGGPPAAPTPPGWPKPDKTSLPSTPENEAIAHRELSQLFDDSFTPMSEEWDNIMDRCVLYMSFEDRIKIEDVLAIVEKAIEVAREHPALTFVTTDFAAMWFPYTAMEMLAQVKRILPPTLDGLTL
jgi:hypothetical protein